MEARWQRPSRSAGAKLVPVILVLEATLWRKAASCSTGISYFNEPTRAQNGWGVCKRPSALLIVPSKVVFASQPKLSARA
jgi:hypothetical protein